MEFQIANPKPEQAEELEALQRLVFPTLAEEEIMCAHHFKNYMKIFPGGQFVVLAEGRIAGSTSTMRCNFDFDHPQHTFLEFTGNLTLSTHDPNGAWLYGLDVMVHPDFRQRGIARLLYRARQKLVKSEKMLGQITTGMLNGYAEFRERLSVEEYFEKLKKGEVFDPTVSTQRKIGWEIVGLVPDYLDDPQCGNYGVLMVLPVEKEV